MTFATRVLRPRLAACLLVCALPAGAAAQEFLQFDLAPSGGTLSASATRGPLGASLTYSRFSGGDETTLSATHAFGFTALGEGATLRLGPALQRDEDGDLRLGAKLALEQYRPTEWGGLFLLGEIGSVNGGYFAMIQPSLSDGVAFEITAAGNDGGYRERALAMSRRIGSGPWRLRAGYRFVEDEIFVGVSINTY